jgi:hypothetical protein
MVPATMRGQIPTRWCAVAFAAALSASCQPAPTLPTPTSGKTATSDGAPAITGELLREHVARLSADELEGRGPGTAGDHLTRAYLVEQLTALGLTKAPGSAGWEQEVELIGVTSAMPKTWTFARGTQQLSLAWWDQYIAGSAVQSESGAIEQAEGGVCRLRHPGARIRLG